MKESAGIIEIIDVLSCFDLAYRSSTLDGLIPLSASQFCSPFVEGCGAGIHIFGRDQVVGFDENGQGQLFYGKDSLISDEIYEARLSALKRTNQINSFWFEKLWQGPSWNENGILNIWTGHLIRPAKNSSVLVSGPYNRRVIAEICDLVYADSIEYQPLIVRFANSSSPIRLSGEFACLTALSSEYSIQVNKIHECLDQAEAVAAFLTDENAHRRTNVGPTGDYKKLVAKNKSPSEDRGRCVAAEMVADTLEIQFFNNYVCAEGIVKGRGSEIGYNDLSYLLVKSNLSMVLGWDGFSLTIDDIDYSKIDLLNKSWLDLPGINSGTLLENYGKYVHLGPSGGARFNTSPWFSFKTSAGWSSFVDGIHSKVIEGLRGVVATDVFHYMPVVLAINSLAKVHIAAGDPIGRVIPTRSEFVKPNFKIISSEL